MSDLPRKCGVALAHILQINSNVFKAWEAVGTNFNKGAGKRPRWQTLASYRLASIQSSGNRTPPIRHYYRELPVCGGHDRAINVKLPLACSAMHSALHCHAASHVLPFDRFVGP
jgi:hypothetical protein